MGNERQSVVDSSLSTGFWFGVILTSLVWYFFII